MNGTDNLIRATDFAVFVKGLRGEWIPYPESGKIYSTVTGEFLKTQKVNGYLRLALTHTSGGKTYKSCIPFHRALWVLCHGVPLSLRAEVDHIDKNRENNTISNLRLISKEENTPRKLDYETAEKIRRQYAEGKTQRELAEEYGRGKSTIGDIIRRETFRCPPEKMYCKRRI